jgi:hypothetical protein
MCSATLAAPVPELINGSQIHSSELGLVKRVRGDSPANAIEGSFDVTNWPNIAEENCYAMLCLLEGNRI